MSSRIDHIILPRHHIEISIFVPIARIPCVVVTWDGCEILFDEFVIVIQNGQHERWRQGFLEVDGAYFERFAELTGCGVDYLDVVTW
jgi:hypothetical protein